LPYLLPPITSTSIILKLGIIQLIVIKEYWSINKRSHDYYPNFDVLKNTLLRFSDRPVETLLSEKDIYLINLVRDSIKDEPKLVEELNKIKKIKHS
jgi:hypothetical protein